MEETAAWSQASATHCLKPTTEVDKELFSNVLAVIKDNSISSLARHDEIILKFGAGRKEEIQLCVAKDVPPS